MWDGPAVVPLTAALASAFAWRWICHSTTSLHVNMKKKTRAGADLSSLSSTAQCKEIAAIIRERRITLAICLMRPENHNKDWVASHWYTMGICSCLRWGMKVRAMPQTISRPPTIRRYHFDGIFTFSQRANGIILAYLTYSCLCLTEGIMI